MRCFVLLLIFVFVSFPLLALDITIDAEKDAFYETLTGPGDGWIYIPPHSTDSGTLPDDENDISSLVWFAWDDDYLYCYVEAKDDIINVNNATSWHNDCF